jgi:hypothetical protein
MIQSSNLKLDYVFSFFFEFRTKSVDWSCISSCWFKISFFGFWLHLGTVWWINPLVQFLVWSPEEHCFLIAFKCRKDETANKYWNEYQVSLRYFPIISDFNNRGIQVSPKTVTIVKSEKQMTSEFFKNSNQNSGWKSRQLLLWCNCKNLCPTVRTN